MRLAFSVFTLFFLFIGSLVKAQDSSLPSMPELRIESLPLSLEEEEEAMILERHQARLLKGQKELKRELSQLASGQQAVEEELFYLQNQQQLSEGGQNTNSQELHSFYKERADLLNQVADMLMEGELLENTEARVSEDWEKAPVRDSKELLRLNELIRKLDTKIALYEMAIPQQIDELEMLEEQIEETMDLADQLIILQESNQALIKKLDK